MQLRDETERRATPKARGSNGDVPPAKKRKAEDAAVAHATVDVDAAPDNEGSVAPEPEVSGPPEAPQPSQLLEGCSAAPACVPLAVALSMDENAYLDPNVFKLQLSDQAAALQEARGSPMFCSLQLKASSANEEELAVYPATLPTTDGLVLSAVIKARLSNWEATASGVTVLELQVGVRQQLLDAVVRGVYARQLSVEPSNAESLLLLADYLQLDWLIKAVRQYLEEHVLPERPLALYELSERFSGLDLSGPATDRVLERLQPAELAALAALRPIAGRLRIFRSIAGAASPVQCLEFLRSLSRLTYEEVHVVTSRHPELAHALGEAHARSAASDCPINTEFLTAIWRDHYELHHQALLTAQLARPVFVWLVPFGELRGEGFKYVWCRRSMHVEDGRRFKLCAGRAQQRSAGGENYYMSVTAHPYGDTVWLAGERISFTVLNSPSEAQSQTVSRRRVGTNKAHILFGEIDRGAADMRTLSGGAYLPLAVEIVPPPKP